MTESRLSIHTFVSPASLFSVCEFEIIPTLFFFARRVVKYLL